MWRVVVVVNDNALDAQGNGSWVPVELVHDGSGTWRGSLAVPGSALATYVVEAVDGSGT